MEGRIASMYRHPVKGLSPEPLARAELKPGGYFPGDRLFAVENGPSGFDAAAPAHQPKVKFLMLMRNARLAALRTRFEDATATLRVERGGREVVRADLASPEGRRAVETFLRDYMADELHGPPRMLAAPEGFRFTDSRRGFVSLINLASVAAIERAVGKPVNPLRFRANVYVAGLPAWAEFDLVGKAAILGQARLKITQRIVRCAATNVDPDLGVRDLAIPELLMRAFGHTECGVYAEVVQGGSIAVGDRLQADGI